MSTTAMHPLAVDYLRRLRQAGRELPPGRLDDLCAEIESHLAEAIPAGASDADALSVIERLGPPEEIVEAERPAAPAPSAARWDGDPRTWREWAAIVLLPLGGIAFGIGWIAGVILLWTSRAWSLRDKLLGTLIVPGGVALVVPVLALTGHPTKWRCTQVTSRAAHPFGPGGHAGCTLVGGSHGGSSAIGVVLAVVIVIASIAVAIHLARAARPRSADPA